MHGGGPSTPSTDFAVGLQRHHEVFDYDNDQQGGAEKPPGVLYSDTYCPCLLSPAAERLLLAIFSDFFYSNWLLFLRVMQENKSGCFFLNIV